MKKLLAEAVTLLYRGLMFSPLALFIGAVTPGCGQLRAGLYYAAGQLLALLMAYVPSAKRVLISLLCGAAYIAAGAYVFALGQSIAPIGLIAVCFALYMFTLRAFHSESRFDSRLMMAGIAIHVIMPVIIQLAGIEVDYTAMMWCGIFYLIMCPMILNDSSVREGMSLRGRGGKPLPRISNANRAMVSVMIVIALIIGNFDRLREAAQRFGQWVFETVLLIIDWILRLFMREGQQGGQGAGGMGDMGAFGEAAEPSWFAKLLEEIMKYVALVIFVVLLAFALWKLCKVIRRLVRRISEWMKQFAQSVKEDYQEEREQLVEWGDVGSEVMASVRDAFRRLTTREKKWGDMDARERVRFVVRQLYRKNGVAVTGIEYMSAGQAIDQMGIKQPMASQLAGLYDEARYSNHDITPEQAETAKNSAK